MTKEKNVPATTPKKRIRTVQFVIHPVAIIDDGDDLTPVTIEPMTVPASQISAFAESYAQQVAAKEDELNGAP